MTLQELQQIHDALIHAVLQADGPEEAIASDALEIITREIDQMTQDQLLSTSKANPT